MGFRGLCASCLAASCLAVVQVAAAESTANATLRERLEMRLRDMNCPGALVGVFPDEGEPVRLALGVADVETRRPMSLDMHMRVGSVMKPFLGVVVLQLCDEGKLSLNDPVSRYVADIPGGEQITLRMLGSNTSGLFNTIENKDFQRAIMEAPDRQWTPGEILAYNEGRQPYNAPGETWRYSNTNAVLLAMCVEKATGRSFAEEIQDRVCRPLGLAHTGVPPAAQLPEPHPSAYRHGYPDKVIGYGHVFYNVSNYSAAWTGAAGNLYATLDDLGRAARPLATGQLLGELGRQALDDWIATGHEGVEYSFLMYRRGGAVGHTGDVPGFNAWMMYDPSLRASVVVLTNLSNNADGTMPADELAKIVAASLSESEGQ